MGHARVVNISRLFNRLIRERGVVTVKEVVDELERRKMALHASEGHLFDRHMLGIGVGQVLWTLYDLKAIEPAEPTPRQKSAIKCVIRGDEMGVRWYGVLDTIRWRALKKRLPVIVNMET